MTIYIDSSLQNTADDRTEDLIKTYDKMQKDFSKIHIYIRTDNLIHAHEAAELLNHKFIATTGFHDELLFYK